MKKFKSLTASVLAFVLMLTMLPLTALADTNMGISVRQVDVASGVFKLVFTVTDSEGFGGINLALSYDNTVIQPVDNAAGHDEVDIATDPSSELPLNILVPSFNFLLVSWATIGDRSAFAAPIYSFTENTSQGNVDVLEFYFSTKTGKTTNDMNATTFRFVDGETDRDMLESLGPDSGIEITGPSVAGGYGDTYVWGSKDTATSPNTIADDKVILTYTNSTVVPGVVVTTPPTASGTYGDTLDAMALTGGDTNVPGTWAWLDDQTQDPATIIPTAVGTQAYTAVFTPDPPSTFPSVTEEITPSVDPLEIEVTPRSGQSKIVGEDDPAELTYDFSPPLIGGDSFTGKLARNTGEGAGTYEITQGNLALNGNYILTFVTGKTFEITDKTPQNISVSGLSDITYGDPAPTLTVTRDGTANLTNYGYNSSNTNVATIDANGVITIVGAGQTTITVTEPGDATYDQFTWSETLTVEKATLTVTADDKDIIYGESPDYSVTYGPFVLGEGPADLDTEPIVSISPPVGKVTAGEHTLMPSAGQSNNYEFDYRSGTLTVNKKDVTVGNWTVFNKKYVEGDVDAVVSGYTIDGLVPGDDVSVDPDQLIAVFDEDEIGEGKNVTITNVVLTGADASNYNLLNNTGSATASIKEELSAEDIAMTITDASIPPIEKDATAFVLPTVPEGYEIAISTSDKPDIIGLDGTVSLVDSDTDVTLTFVVTKTDDGSFFETAAFTVTVPESTKYTISITHGNGGIVDGSGTYMKGESVTVVATPNDDYEFDGWFENNTKIEDADASYTFEATADRVLEARFLLIEEEDDGDGDNGNGNNGGGGSSGGGGGGGGGTVTPPASKGENIVNDNVINASNSTTVSNDTTVASITTEDIKNAISNLQEDEDGGNKEIVIKMTTEEDTSGAVVTMPIEAMEEIVNNKDLSLVIEVDGVKLVFSNEALAGIVNSANGDVEISIDFVGTIKGGSLENEAVLGRPAYELNVNDNGKQISNFNGTVTVRIQYKPGNGENPNALVIYLVLEDGSLKPIANSRYENGTQSFRTEHFSTYVIGYNPVNFMDVTSAHWASNSVEKAGARGLVSGMGNNMYAPENDVTRAQFAQLMLNLLELQVPPGDTAPYSDVNSASWYYGAVCAAKQAGLFDGFIFTNGMFLPDQAIDREEMAVVLANAAKINKISAGDKELDLSDRFSDFGDMNENYLSFIEDTVKLNLLRGVSEDSFLPKGKTTRAQAAQVIMNLIDVLWPIE